MRWGWLCLILFTVGCSGWDRPTGPTTTVNGNGNTVIVPTGSNNAGGTGTCSAAVAATPGCPVTTQTFSEAR